MAVITQDQRYEDVLHEEGGKPSNMCELLDRVEAEGVAKGLARGLAEGEATGMAKGRREGRQEGIDLARLESIRSIMDGLNYTSRQAMDLLNIPAEDRQRYASKL